MSNDLLGRLLAGRIDHWPDDTDYQSEVDKFTEIFAGIGEQHGPISSVLGFGDGGRRHLDLLASAGYDTAAGSAETDRQFDAVLTMSSTLGRQLTDEALAATLTTIGNRLRPGGLLVFDILDANVVLRQEPGSMFSRTVDGDTQFVQAVLASVDNDVSVLGLQVRLWRMAGESVADQIDESWSIRFFLPRELVLVLAINGFELLGNTPLGNGHDGSASWHRLAWARKL